MLHKVSEFILTKVFRWRIVGVPLTIPKAIIIFAPHTSYWDGFYGKLYLMSLRKKYVILAAKHLFRFPFNSFFRLFGAIPVEKNLKFVEIIAQKFNLTEQLYIILSPEGQIAKTDHWHKGFYYIASKADVPIAIGCMDYKKRTIGVGAIILQVTDIANTMEIVNNTYANVQGKYPQNFTLDNRF